MVKYVTAGIVGFIVAAAIAFGMNFFDQATGSKPDLITVLAPVFVGVLIAYVMANLAGNRKVATASAAEKAQALTLQAPPGRGLLIVYRKGYVGKAAGLNLALDGQPLAQLRSPRFTAIPVTPGEHVLSASFGGLAGPQNKVNTSMVTFQPGEVLAVKAGVSMGLIQNTIKLEAVPVDDDLKRILTGMPMVAPETSAAPLATA